MRADEGHIQSVIRELQPGGGCGVRAGDETNSVRRHNAMLAGNRMDQRIEGGRQAEVGTLGGRIVQDRTGRDSIAVLFPCGDLGFRFSVLV